MMNRNGIFNRALALLAAVPFVACQEAQEERYVQELWYDAPATEWIKALPIGNGHMGAMVFGDPKEERIQLNEDSLWPGGPDWGDFKGTPEDLAALRALLKAGDTHLVDSLIVEKFSYKKIVRSHQTMGDLFIDFKGDRETTDYRRSLSLDKALVSVDYKVDGHHFQERVFASHPDDVMVVELSTENPDGMDFTLRMDRPQDKGYKTVTVTNPSDTEISMQGTVTQYGGIREDKPLPMDYGVQFETRLSAKHKGGAVVSRDGSLDFTGVQSATLYLVAATSFYHEDYRTKNSKTLETATQKSFEVLLEDHSKDHRNLYDRVQFDLGGKDLDSLPTNVRLDRVKSGQKDPDLEVKLFDLGRYLLIASSRPGTNPANLQGLWNHHIEAPWNADYHVNINLQMNYWPAEVTNLSELHMPMFDLTDKMYARGKQTAREQYGMSGHMFHHTSDLWATPWMRANRAYWGSWIHGGGWIAQHYWTHYQFTQDKDFLRERAWPVFKGLAEFYTDWVIFDPKSGYYISSPETSPENSYFNEEGKPAAVSEGSAMGHQIIGELFDNFLETAQILGETGSLVDDVQKKSDKLHPGVLIGEDGRILEWNEPYGEPEKGHRHMSHLYALHPGDAIVPTDTAAFEAAKKSIAYRLQYGGAGTGWSRAWMINFNARLHQAEKAEENIQALLAKSTSDNLFNQHPPFQIDGNFGYTAAVAELLLQSHEGFIRLLPTLPPSWKTGTISGLKARGNITVAMSWENGELTAVSLESPIGQDLQLVYKEKELSLELQSNTVLQLDGNLNTTNK